MCVFAHVYAYMGVHVSTYVSTCVRVCVYIFVHVRMHACVCMCVRMRACIFFECVFVYTDGVFMIYNIYDIVHVYLRQQ